VYRILKSIIKLEEMKQTAYVNNSMHAAKHLSLFPQFLAHLNIRFPWQRTSNSCANAREDRSLATLHAVQQRAERHFGA
jgi:hypothetical protein